MQINLESKLMKLNCSAVRLIHKQWQHICDIQSGLAKKSELYENEQVPLLGQHKVQMNLKSVSRY